MVGLFVRAQTEGRKWILHCASVTRIPLIIVNCVELIVACEVVIDSRGHEVASISRGHILREIRQSPQGVNRSAKAGAWKIILYEFADRRIQEALRNCQKAPRRAY